MGTLFSEFHRVHIEYALRSVSVSESLDCFHRSFAWHLRMFFFFFAVLVSALVAINNVVIQQRYTLQDPGVSNGDKYFFFEIILGFI
jgi:hypothetical protein